MTDRVADPERRVLVFAPVGRDGALTKELLGRAAIDSCVCASIDELCTELGSNEAGAVILTEEALDEGAFASLSATLDQQPAWSDIPVILFAGTGRASVSTRTLELLDVIRNLTVIERPIRVAAVVSIVRAAIRARFRQYEMRAVLVALHAARIEAENASRLKDEFLATLSHELRTPLNAILGWTTMLRHGQVDRDRIAHALDVVDRNARAQAQLIEDVLDMARIITGKLRIQMKPLSLPAVVDTALEAVRPAAEAKRIRLTMERGSSVPDVRGDSDRLQQVLWNLLSNAIKFTPPEGQVKVRIGLGESQAIITVSDTGAGLAPEFLPFVFDRFRQGDQSITRGHGGLGLGLAIVKHLVELHGGRVMAESDGIGHGSTFSVVLPVPALAVGFTLMRRIRTLPGESGGIPSIALSAYTRAEDRAAARDAGFSAFVAKPASPQELLRMVDRLVATE
ncbi:MAG: hybrid sensor histidine kinase/response regulator [Acidobacteria bacterium]|nr:hybrid sensor histidine kinase/response regulator [Acidobacteriota bacterium]